MYHAFASCESVVTEAGQRNRKQLARRVAEKGGRISAQIVRSMCPEHTATVTIRCTPARTLFMGVSRNGLSRKPHGWLHGDMYRLRSPCVHSCALQQTLQRELLRLFVTAPRIVMLRSIRKGSLAMLANTRDPQRCEYKFNRCLRAKLYLLEGGHYFDLRSTVPASDQCRHACGC